MYQSGTLISVVMIKNAGFMESKYEATPFFKNLFLLEDSWIELFLMTGLAILVLAVLSLC